MIPVEEEGLGGGGAGLKVVVVLVAVVVEGGGLEGGAGEKVPPGAPPEAPTPGVVALGGGLGESTALEGGVGGRADVAHPDC